MAAANGSGGKGFEVPKVEVRFTKLFINGHFVDAVSDRQLQPLLIRNLYAGELQKTTSYVCHFEIPSSPVTD
ncbi:aldehyde dehydrogenase family 2 member C4-like isoform X2 [Panicum miliaceum]|uniref:Aldehyde dehydrogenase family 2 member C4-like isoform X2 n=1 Tax=Panicum miliaceum TaxID=4540 RepID=A0A3L6SM54_PANMI|nr:aldehyde dehydrogenase family 2 member C4-like isoform X2 [Panicum miliaceum]